jgi:transposase
MPRERTDMRSVREIIRLSQSLNLSANEIHRITGTSRGTIQNILRRIKDSNLTWPLPAEMDDHSLEAALYGSEDAKPGKFEEPDWSYIHKELKRRGVNIRLLWEEYSHSTTIRYSYSQFCRRYRKWCKQCDIEMLQIHHAGDKLFVDYAGDTIRVTNRETGEVTYAQIFVGVLGASNYCYCEATENQSLRCWIQAHARMLTTFGGVPKCLVPDNLKSAVTKADRWDPTINETYRRLAEHYGCAIRPARVQKPKDKAKVEKGVQFAETWVLARIRNMEFFSFVELNEVIQEVVEELNDRPFQKLSGTRRTWFDSIDKPALQKLPQKPFEFEEWNIAITVPKNYHIRVDEHHYSVPYKLRNETVDIRKTDDMIEVFHNNTRVASHVRNRIEHGTTTDEEHRAPAHAAYSGLSPEYFLHEAGVVGKSTRLVVQHILAEASYPQLAFDKCFGIVKSLQNKYGAADLERACQFALTAGSPAYPIVKHALKMGVDNLPVQQTISPEFVNSHKNIRGATSFKNHDAFP